jgi:cytochrome oxidase Cu insertion factor (SCO1/SenC/PrrC family)
MKRILCVALVVTLAAVRQGHAQSAEESALRSIRAAGGTTAIGELAGIVRTSASCCSKSTAISNALTQWLRESHPIYAGRMPSQAAQFRGFLLASLGGFAPNDELRRYVKSELTFNGHPFNVAAAAVAARAFPESSEELRPLLEPYLGGAFVDEAVDVMTPELTYPLAHPTRARAEIVKTMEAFDAVPACCRRHPTAGTLEIVDKHRRKRVSARAVKLEDQDGKALEFADLRGRPFVLAFFYSQCTNQLKCVSTVRQLQFLSAACAKDNLSARVGIYAMTYDPHFDTAPILRQYGRMHGLKFAPNVRLLKSAGSAPDALREELNLRVSYGAGTVSQHGTQLFVFDKEGRIAATVENEVWSAAEVKNCLAKLVAE